MPLTEPQRKFVVTYIQDKALRDERRAERTGDAPDASFPDDPRRARMEELAKIKPSTFVKGGEHDGEVATDHKGDVVTGSVKDTHDELVSHLRATGRAEPDASSTDSRAALKEAHLSKIYLMDEHGVNAHRLMEKLMTVDSKTRAAAARPITPEMSGPDRKATEKARMDMAKYEAMRGYLEDRIIAETDAEKVALGQEAARTHALAKLATENGNLALAHHASRHGPQTTLDAHATRVVTGFAPDHPDAAATTEQTYQTDEGRSVKIRDSRASGGEVSSQASRMKSAAFGLELIERAMANAAVFVASGELKSGQQLVTRVKQDETEPAIGEAVKLSYSHALDAEIDSGGAALPKAETLDDAAADKAEVIRKRALALKINDAVFGAEALVAMQSDGSVSISTAYPAESVNKDALGGDPTLPDNTTPEEHIKAQEAKIRTKRVQAAQASAKDAQDAADKLRPKVTQATDEARVALTEYYDLLKVFPTDATAEIIEAQTRAHTLAEAEATHLAAEAAATDLAKLRDTCVAQDAALVEACRKTKEAHERAEARLAGSPDNRNFQVSEAITKARRESAEELKDNTAATVAALVKQIEDEEQRAKDAADALAAAQLAFDTARSAAVAKSTAEKVDELLAAEQKQRALRADMSQLRAEIANLENLAKLAMEIARETAENVAETVESDDPTEVAARQQERDDRKDVLAQALDGKAGAFKEAHDAWSGEIDAVEAMFAADAAARKQSLDALSERRDAAAQAAVDARNALEAAKSARQASQVEAEHLVLDNDIIRLEAARDVAIERSDKLGKALKQAKGDDDRRARTDSANIATARAALETLSAEVKAEKAVKDGAADAVKLGLQADVARAQEAATKSDRDHAAALEIRIDANEHFNAMVAVAERVSEHHEKAKAEYAKAVVAGTENTPDMQRLKTRIDERFKPETDAALLRRNDAEKALKDLEKEVSGAATRRDRAQAELTKAQEALSAVG